MLPTERAARLGLDDGRRGVIGRNQNEDLFYALNSAHGWAGIPFVLRGEERTLGKKCILQCFIAISRVSILNRRELKAENFLSQDECEEHFCIKRKLNKSFIP